MATLLVTGGCGYIGSHIVRQLTDQGHRVVVIDNLSTGYKNSLLNNEVFFQQDLADQEGLANIFNTFKFDTVFHLAASIVVPESVVNPLFYYQNNTVNTLNLLRATIDAKVNSFIFSSTAAVYGDGHVGPIREDSNITPTNPYAKSKLMDEWIIEDVAKASNLRYVILRYFNVAGASFDARIGQRFMNATHLIKVACEAALGKRPLLKVFGSDYDTPDGTGIRDYIHVEDLASAHLSAFEFLQNPKAKSDIFNCGYGRGYSVREVIRAVETVSGIKIPTDECSRRPGDVSSLIADVAKIHKNLPWKPKYDDLLSVAKTAFEFEKSIRG